MRLAHPKTKGHIPVHPSHDPNPREVRNANDAARGPAALPMNVIRVRDDFNSLKPGYRRWLEQQTPEDPDEIMDLVSFVLTNCAMREAHTRITALSIPCLRSVLGFVGEQFPETF
ncbi:hypothetical protein [Paeniglutamicibacter psychrophenolicus]|uniref:hypothetical protein n=1 Tax=Paeniglutamicibacter psychrophenolicus TaxID=257454 RepID=UPI00278187E3|nr:hypothetical protein [Paeniglutamicibacter psychrophenolicus]MDQ0094993.1 hypothetical protein [Paeniglutamicibacter psychrophenolicus]